MSWMERGMGYQKWKIRSLQHQKASLIRSGSTSGRRGPGTSKNHVTSQPISPEPLSRAISPRRITAASRNLLSREKLEYYETK